jgi:hypothetical protein
MTRSQHCLALAIALGAIPALAHADCRAQSAGKTVAVIELYTSEGCDSCPPADRWLSGIDLPASSAIALGLHVDYWDRLGWKDRFATAGFTARQYEQMRRQGGEFVYTPQVLVQGRNFRQWGARGEAADAVAAINAQPARATIGLAAQLRPDSAIVDVSVSVAQARDRARARTAVALVQDRLVSTVTAGENGGKRLTHDHVVRQWHAAPALDASGELHDRVSFALPADGGPLSVVALAEDSVTGDILQALSLPLSTTACQAK